MNDMTIQDLQVSIRNKNIINFNNHFIAIEKGDKVAILGANGAGKTTLIKCILNLISFKGRINLDIPSSHIGVVFQQNNYSDLLKVYEIFQMVFGFNNDKNIHSIIKQYNLEHLKKLFIKDLSGGEKQRLTLALTLGQNYPFYIFDELTSGLDFEKRKSLMDSIKKNTRESTVLTISHYFNELTDWINKILVMSEGEIVFWGELTQFNTLFDHHGIFRVEQALPETPNIKTTCFKSSDSIQYFVFSDQEFESFKTVLKRFEINYTFELATLETRYLLALKNHAEKGLI
ncbi:ATP-binding cassette domain-containing protein [Listeria valentina]|uniref:ATP-binding cassette domain-containing protein n=1 Tax=Listeria valentina TaxID=2705293 RepID=UPI001431E6B9|nr:ABC transporter ATP-binding protein [Listeria valentina]